MKKIRWTRTIIVEGEEQWVRGIQGSSRVQIEGARYDGNKGTVTCTRSEEFLEETDEDLGENRD